MSMYDKPISGAQITFIRSLLADRLVTLGMPSVDEAEVGLNLRAMNMADASTIIGRLKGMAKDPDVTMPAVVAQAQRNGKGNRPGRCHACGHTVEADTGFYFLTGGGKWAVHHVVGGCDTTPAAAPVQVAEGHYQCGKDIVQVYRTGNGRLAGKVLNRRGKFDYRQGATKLVENGGVLLSSEELVNAVCMSLYGALPGSDELHAMAHRYGVEHGNCMFCGLDLTDERSNPALGGKGYGPVCARKYGLPWGEVKS